MSRSADPIDTADLLAALVAVPSVTPRDAEPSGSAPGESQLASWVASWCTDRGIDAAVTEVLPGRRDVTATVPGARPARVVLEAHLDTVETTGMTVPPFGGGVRDGRLYGRGACDTKASLAAFLAVLAAAHDRAAAGDPLPVTVCLAGTVDEEHGYRGVLAWLDRELSGDCAPLLAAVVGEPTGLRLGRAHTGVVRGTVEVTGRSGHSSRPAEARSAVVLATDVVRAVEAGPGTDEVHPLLGPATRTVVRVQAGEGPNVVPGRCELDIDRRTLPAEDPHEVWRAIGAELTALHPGAIRLLDPFVTDVGLDTPADAPVVVALSAALARHGLDAEPCGLSYGSDASKFARAGVPAVVLGPGSITDAHTSDESVDLAEVDNCVEVLLDALAHWSVP